MTAKKTEENEKMIRVSISKENIERMQKYAERKHPGINMQIGTRSPKIGANDLLTEMLDELEGEEA